ncbi:MAG: hypothetical protein R2713_15640 [Ilumatobacteraceae bacterium]
MVFLQGCSFDCLACHNPHPICRRETARSRWVEVDDVVADVTAAAPFLSGVTRSRAASDAAVAVRPRGVRAARHCTGDREPPNSSTPTVMSSSTCGGTSHPWWTGPWST